jgi:ankyrin repeat protein
VAVLCSTVVGVGLKAAGVDDSAVAQAMKQGERQRAWALIQKGASVTTPLGDGSTALHWAAYRSDIESMDRLLRAGADVNAVNDLDATPLWVAASAANAGTAAKLLQAGADPSRSPATGGTPLMIAARRGDVDMVAQLLRAGADVNAAEASRGQTALMWAVTKGHSEVIQQLIDGGANIEARSRLLRTVVLPCCQHYPLDSGSHWTDLGGFTPLLFASRLGNVAAAERLLDAGADVDVKTPEGATALVVSAHSGQAATTALLLERGADPNAAGNGYTALHAAVLRENEQMVKELLAYGADPNARIAKGTWARRSQADYAFMKEWVGATPIWLAAGFQKTGIIDALVAAGGDPLLTSPDGTTALMTAAVGLSPRALFQSIVVVLPRGEEQPTLAAVTRLANLGVPINATNADGDTALHRAASKRFDTVVQFLVDRGASVSAKDNEGRTPLVCALDHCHLLNAEAEKKGFSSAGAFRAFREKQNSVKNTTVELLRQLGATN